MPDGNSLMGYQHLANLLTKLIKDASESNPSKGMVLSGYCTSWKSDMPIVCPLQEKDDGTYTLLPDGVFENEDDVYLSLAVTDEDKVVITPNRSALQVDVFNRIKAAVSPPEEYWQREVLSAMESWYMSNVDPYFGKSKEKLDNLIDQTNESQKDVKNAAAQCYDVISAL